MKKQRNQEEEGWDVPNKGKREAGSRFLEEDLPRGAQAKGPSQLCWWQGRDREEEGVLL